MAKSKSGGSRAYIRGRIGSDVYSIGKDGKGARQQVVRSLAVQVSNPRTPDQMVGRMIMSTIMQGVSALRPIIDHSFDGIASGQPSISEFIRRNYAKAKAAYLANNLSQAGGFNMNKYQEKGMLTGSWVISDGAAVLPADFKISSGWGGLISCYFIIPSTAELASLTAKFFYDHWTIGDDDYITMIGNHADGEDRVVGKFLRVKINKTLAPATAITADNVSQLFTLEGNVPGEVFMQAATSSASGYVAVRLVADPDLDITGSLNEDCGYIYSKKTENGYIHSTLELNEANDMSVDNVTYADALATYPVGSEMFLNGGDL